jgi:hypothetical protein
VAHSICGSLKRICQGGPNVDLDLEDTIMTADSVEHVRALVAMLRADNRVGRVRRLRNTRGFEEVNL